MKWRMTLALLLAFSSARAVILFRTGDPAANTTEPTGPGYANSGWQYEGAWGSFLGTPIAPRFLLSANHVGNQGLLKFQGADYHAVQVFPDPQSDLTLHKIAEIFPSFAPLYSRTDEVGQRIIEIGRGTQRGTAVMLNNVLMGWYWGPGDNVMRWGENVVSGILPYGIGNDLLFANFDQDGLPNECHFSSGDSGGAAFIEDTPGIWKLAGINYAVDGPFYPDPTGVGAFFATLFDARGFYYQENNNYVLITGADPVPTALYPTRISTKLPWICATIAEPQVGSEDDGVTLTFTRIVLPPTDVVYSVLQSNDLSSWATAVTTDEIISTSGSTQVVKSKVAFTPGTGPLFLRLEVKRP